MHPVLPFTASDSHGGEKKLCLPALEVEDELLAPNSADNMSFITLRLFSLSGSRHCRSCRGREKVPFGPPPESRATKGTNVRASIGINEERCQIRGREKSETEMF